MSNIKLLKQTIDSPAVKKRFQDILGDRASTFSASIVQITNQSSMLAEAEPSSIIGSALTAATLNLPLNNSIGQAYIVPFKTKEDGRYVTKAQFILGYKGLKQLAVRSGQFKEMYAKPVYKGQKIEDDSFLGFRFDWSNKESEEVIGYASYFKLINGFESMYFMSTSEMEKHAKKYSQVYKKSGKGLWADDKQKMSLKTVAKLHLNSGEAPLSIDMQSAIERDQSVVDYGEDGETVDYPDAVVKEEVDEDHERIVMLIEQSTTKEELEFAKEHAKDDKYKEIIKNKEKELAK